jgi:DinB superfamily
MPSSTTSHPKLQAPGAGLPAFELAWLGAGFRLACAMLPQRVAMQLFKREGEKILSLARSTSARQGAVPVLIDRITGIEDSSRYWSVFMVLDHLRIVNEGIALIIEDLNHDRPFTQEIRIQDVKPSPDSGPEAVERYIQSVSAYEGTINRLGKFSDRVRHPHPWFGPMTAGDWHCLAGIHHFVHRRQIVRIKQVLENDV